jgi:hypothetical protein
MGSKLTPMTRRRMYNHFSQQVPFEGNWLNWQMTFEVAGILNVGIIQIRARIRSSLEYQRILSSICRRMYQIDSPPSNIFIWMDSPVHQPLYQFGGWIHLSTNHPNTYISWRITIFRFGSDIQYPVTAKAMLSHLKHRIYDILILSVLLNQ